jgi:hypothetical protein
VLHVHYDGDVDGRLDGRETTETDLGPATVEDEPFAFPPVTAGRHTGLHHRADERRAPRGAGTPSKVAW